MSMRGENIYKRKDGRWEGRYISGRKPDGSAKYSSVYGKSYREAKALLEKQKLDKGSSVSVCFLTVEELMKMWLAMRVAQVKESSYQRYETLINCHILPRLGGIRVSYLTTGILYDRRGFGLKSVRAIFFPIEKWFIHRSGISRGFLCARKNKIFMSLFIVLAQ